MATYIATVKFTEKGIQAFKDTTRRADAFKAAARKMGIKVSGLYWTLGRFDGAIIFDAPDEVTATAAMLQLGALGNITTQTARAFNASEMTEILGKISS